MQTVAALGKEIVFHRDKVKEVYKTLQADCDLYTNNATGLGTQHDFDSYAKISYLRFCFRALCQSG